MDYINFITDSRILKKLRGSTFAAIHRLEGKLEIRIPVALKEYLTVSGETCYLFNQHDSHGTKDIQELKEWLDQFIAGRRAEGVQLNEISNILPFLYWQDTFFFVPLESGNDDPPVYAFDVDDNPEIRLLGDHFSEFIRKQYATKIYVLNRKEELGI